MNHLGKDLADALTAARIYMTDNGIGQNELARRAGISPATMSQMFNKEYKGDTIVMIRKLNDFLVPRSSAIEERMELASIRNLRRIHDVIRRTREEHEIAVIVGAPGTGKTEAAKAWCMKDDQSVYLRVNGAMNKSELMQLLANKLGRRSNRNIISSNLQECKDALTEEEKTLIFDESDRLSVPCLNLVRDLYDETDRCGVVFLGDLKLLNVLKFGHSRKDNLAQLYSRVGYLRQLEPLSPDDVAAALQFNGVTKASDSACKEIAVKVANAGGIRTVTKLCARAKQLALKNESSVNDKVLLEAFKYLVRGKDDGSRISEDGGQR